MRTLARAQSRRARFTLPMKFRTSRWRQLKSLLLQFCLKRPTMNRLGCPARVHTGPSVDTPTSHFYPVGTPLRATRYQHDWFEIIEPSTSKTGWIYRKYLGAISDSEQTKIASQEAQGRSPIDQVSVPVKRYANAVPVKRYAKAIPVKRYANTIRSSKQSTRVKPVTSKPIRGRTVMASLLQRAFSGY